MSKVKEDQIEQWQFESATRRKHLGELEKQTEAIKASKTILDPRVIKEKEEILREIEMEQQELCHREMKTNLSINQQEQQKEDVKTKRGGSESVGIKEQELIG